MQVLMSLLPADYGTALHEEYNMKRTALLQHKKKRRKQFLFIAIAGIDSKKGVERTKTDQTGNHKNY
jgi:hypothetical protein